MRRAKKWLVLIISLWNAGNCFCQFTPFQDEDAIVTPNFNLEVIRAKRISQITVQYLSKPDGAPIKDEGISKQYLFDSAGKISEALSAVKSGDNGYDSVKCKYYYNGNRNIVIKRTQTGDFYDTWYYKWDNDGRMQTEYHVHETSEATANAEFRIATQKVISLDSFAYTPYPKQLQQYAYNEDGKCFKKTITQLDDNGYMVSRNCHYVVGWLYSEMDADYDASGRITRYKLTGNLNGDRNEEIKIKYDSTGKISEENIWTDGKQKHHIEYMYDNETGLVSNKLDRDDEKGVISIVRFNYEMYDNNGNTAAK